MTNVVKWYLYALQTNRCWKLTLCLCPRDIVVRLPWQRRTRSKWSWVFRRKWLSWRGGCTRTSARTRIYKSSWRRWARSRFVESFLEANEERAVTLSLLFHRSPVWRSAWRRAEQSFWRFGRTMLTLWMIWKHRWTSCSIGQRLHDVPMTCS